MKINSYFNKKNKMLPDILKSDEIQIPFPMERNWENSENKNATQLHIEPIIPGIYHSSSEIFWTSANLLAHGFTHIIRIDKHISYLHLSTNNETINNSLRNYNQTFRIFQELKENSVHKSKDFEILDLNFGEESYLTTVLPNCYKAVKYINKTLQNGGAIIIIDHNNNLQKCLTIVTAYIMYKNNCSFNEAFQKLQKNYDKAELDGFFIRQLYEYEPILQVQRAQAMRGNSCSRDISSAKLKRKKFQYDNITNDYYANYYETNTTEIIGDILME